VAEALEGGPGGAPPEVLAYHYARGGVPDKAVFYLEQAGDRAWGQRAHGAAEGHYREALHRLERLGRVQDTLVVREKLAEVLYAAGRYDAAVAVLERAARIYGDAGDLEGLVRVTAGIGRVHAEKGTPHESLGPLTALLERVERAGIAARLLATLHHALGWLLLAAGQYDGALAASERAAALARTADDARTLALAEQNRTTNLQMLGRLNDALQVGQAVLPLVERVGDLTSLMTLHEDVASVHALQGAFATSKRSLDRAVAQAEQVGIPARLAFILAVRGWIAVLSGEWTSARADLDQALALSRQADLSWYSSYPLVYLARLCLAEGEWATAEAAVQEAITLADRGGDLSALRIASGVLAEIDIQEGRAQAARTRLLPLLDRPGLEECDVTELLPVLA
jgi:tetratricopeptide (TPR) repeat protein